uniref:(northern house mosquito) hypothetical protein n=1 Tax=Culex pipiens TaxID=7175 RepID=A0A8D8IZZ8_CULPI
MNRLSRWIGRLTLRSSTKTRFPQQQQWNLHKKVTTTYSFDSVDYEEIGLPTRFWSRFTRSNLFKSKQEKSPKSSRSFSWLPGAARPSPEALILQEQLQEDRNQLARWRLNESDLKKRRGYFCATNRPLICVCDCPVGTYSRIRPAEDRPAVPRTQEWDARWVFSTDLERLEVESYERIERMLYA